MDVAIALTTTLHQIRTRLPEAAIAQETGIRPNQLRKFRNGARKPTVDDWQAIIRCVHEVDAEAARTLACTALPAELYTPLAADAHPDKLGREVIQAASAAGSVSATYLKAMQDGKLSAVEIEEQEGAYRRLLAEAQDGLAACEKARQANHGSGQRRLSLEG